MWLKTCLIGFVEGAVAIVAKYKLGNPARYRNNTWSEWRIKRFADEVRAQTNEAIAAGAKAHINRFAQDDDGAYLTPQILTNVHHDMRVMRDESFGPVVGIMPVRDDDEAIALFNDSDFGLTASLWTPWTLSVPNISVTRLKLVPSL